MQKLLILLVIGVTGLCIVTYSVQTLDTHTNSTNNQDLSNQNTSISMNNTPSLEAPMPTNAINNPRPKSSLESQKYSKNSKQTKIFVKASSGIGTYPDLQVPNAYNETQVRADGNIAPQPTSQHTGIPMQVEAGVNIEKEKYVAGAHIQATHISSIKSSAQSPGASYFRKEIGVRAGIKHPISDWTSTFTLGLIARRSHLNNISTGHYVDGIMPELGIQLARRPWTVKTTGAYAVSSGLSYDSDGEFKSHQMQDSDVNMSNYTLSIERSLTKDTDLVLSAEQERLLVKTQNPNEYSRFGLSIDENQEIRSYELNTHVLSMGLKKSF